MRRFVVIGVGHFGYHAAAELFKAGREVVAIDADPEKVQDISEHVTQAVVADATDRYTLESIGVREADVAIISLGERMDLITLAALHVVELGVPHVAVKALSEEHARILTAVGVHEVIRPEKEMACRLANRLAMTDVVEFLPLLPGYSIIELRAPKEFIGKSLRELAMRNTLKVQLVAIESRKGAEKRVNIVPKAEDVIEKNDLLILLGENRDLDHVREIVKTDVTAKMGMP